ncbi:MAG TPA: tRNA (adenosine(37)-N6)-threonylcarbamoyltransferase complex transferase subunit TsaD [Desulfomonilia bacterium]
MNILAIETSCDETAAAVVTDGGKILSSVVASQIKDHAAFGGVVPEIAARRHVELISPVVETAIKESGITLKDLGGIAVTRGPGLVGALLVGISYAKALAYGLDIPVAGVNHLDGHLAAVRIDSELTYPHMGMVVSGGHTSIYKVDEPEKITLIGQTMDDAAGEAFDKVAKLLNLGYPGGVVIEKIASGVTDHGLELPRPMLREPGYDFSFSGLKTAVLNLVVNMEIFPGMDLSFSGLPSKKIPAPGKEDMVPKIAAAFQEAAVDVLVSRLMKAALDHRMNLVVISGGVACNTSLRNELKKRTEAAGIRLVLPEKKYCTDNAAMIGIASIKMFEKSELGGLDMNAVSRWNEL